MSDLIGNPPENQFPRDAAPFKPIKTPVINSRSLFVSEEISVGIKVFYIADDLITHKKPIHHKRDSRYGRFDDKTEDDFG